MLNDYFTGGLGKFAGLNYVAIPRTWKTFKEPEPTSARMILPTEEALAHIRPRFEALQREGIQPRSIIEYAMHLTSYRDFNSISGAVSSDLIAVDPELLQSPSVHRRLLHMCLDAIGEVSQAMIPLLEKVTGRHQPLIQFERFVGRDVVVSFPT